MGPIFLAEGLSPIGKVGRHSRSVAGHRAAERPTPPIAIGGGADPDACTANAVSGADGMAFTPGTTVRFANAGQARAELGSTTAEALLELRACPQGTQKPLWDALPYPLSLDPRVERSLAVE